MGGVAENDSGPDRQHRRGDHPACPPADLAGGSGGTLAVVATRGAGPQTASGTVLTPTVESLALFSVPVALVHYDVEKAALHRRLPEHPGQFVMR